MSLTREQRLALELAGTVALPSPFPALAEISVRPEPEPESNGTRHELPGRRPVHLEIRHVISPKLAITRSIYLDHIRALFLPDDPDSVRYDKGTWLLGTEVHSKCFDRLAEASARNGNHAALAIGKGIVFIPEATQLFMHVEVGMTAAESAQYYPPLPGEWGVNPNEICNPEAAR